MQQGVQLPYDYEQVTAPLTSASLSEKRVCLPIPLTML